MINDHIYKRVYGFKTKYQEGFTADEIKELLKFYPHIDMDKYYKAVQGDTCAVIDNQIIQYHCAIEEAIRCGLENRDIKPYEFD